MKRTFADCTNKKSEILPTAIPNYNVQQAVFVKN